MLAIRYSSETLYRQLLSKSVNFKVKNFNEETPLFIATAYASVPIIREILKLCPNLINVHNKSNISSLQNLINRGIAFIDIFQEFVAAGADIHVTEFETKNTLLHIAVLQRMPEFVHLFLKLGVDPCRTNHKMANALYVGARHESLEMFKAILHTGKIDIIATNHTGDTVLHAVNRCYFPGFFNALFEYINPNVNVRNHRGETPIHFCYDSERFKVLIAA